jgi:DHA2 family methylenomycin A resistance protein-like MFS transporter
MTTATRRSPGVGQVAQGSDSRATPADWLALATVSVGLFLAVLSTTVVSVALPTIGRDLHASASDLEWVVDAYVLVYATLLLTFGALGDRFERKALFGVGVSLFGIGSLLSGVAPTTVLLLGGRVIQGAGAAVLVPGSLTIIRLLFAEPRQRATAIGLWSTNSGLALAVGPPLGGALVDLFGWRAVFLINAPLVVLVLLAIARFVPRLPVSRATQDLDWLGMLLPIVGIGALVLAVIDGGTLGWQTWLIFGLGIASLVALVAWESTRRHPLIDVRLFRRPLFAAANIAAFAVFFAFVGAIIYFSAFFQQVQDLSATATGLAVAAIGIAYAIAASVSGRAVSRFGERWLLLLGMVMCGVALLGLVRLEADTGMESIWWNFAFLGLGAGLCGTPMSTIAMSSVDGARAGMASALINAMRQVGQVFGVAVLGAAVYGLLPQSAAGQHLDTANQLLFVDGLHHAMLIAAGCMAVATLLVALLLGRAR